MGDLETKLGANANLLITYDGTSWNSRSGDVPITASLGILVSMSAATEVIFEGQAWADGSITLAAGSNLIGLPVNDARVTNVSDIIGLFAANTVSSVIVASGGTFEAVSAAGAASDGPVAGDAAYLVIATAAGSATLSGDGWSQRCRRCRTNRTCWLLQLTTRHRSLMSTVPSLTKSPDSQKKGSVSR